MLPEQETQQTASTAAKEPIQAYLQHVPQDPRRPMQKEDPPEQEEKLAEMSMVPTQHDREESDKIYTLLKDDYNQYETPAAESKKRAIIAQLQTIIVDWIKRCYREEQRSEDEI